MTGERPNAEELLARIKEEETRSARGRLKIFLGMAAGVGKTYKMLESAKVLIRDGVDVVAGSVVTHGRKETEALLSGIEVLPPRVVDYKGSQFEELDLDAALKRDPTVILVDELAHSNVPGCRHDKRWQDVEELLENGIHVYTTMNIQHLESANDIVTQITRIKVRETIPDSFFEKAYEIELVDLPPDELIQRIKDGKVYLGDKSVTALENFFRKGNLIALREMALRSTAARVDKQMQKYRQDEEIQTVWPTADRIMVCVGPSPLSQRVVRSACRIASGLNAEWLAVYVETPVYLRLSKKVRMQLINTLRMAESLGAETAVLSGTNVVEELVACARKRNVSRILIGKPARPVWRELLFGSVANALIRHSNDIDILVVSGEGDYSDTPQADLPQRFSPGVYTRAVVVFVAATLVASLIHNRVALVNLVMIYQLAVVWNSVRYGRGPSILSAVLSVAACDFFFVPPYFSFAVSDTQYLITLLTMLVVALTLSTLTHNLKQQIELSRLRERRTSSLFAMSKEQAVSATKEEVANTSAKHIKDVFDAEVTIAIAQNNELSVLALSDNTRDLEPSEKGVAEWVFRNGQVAGAGTSTLPGARAIYLPLRGSSEIIGVIGVRANDESKFLHPEEMHLLELFVNQIGLAIERALLTAHPNKINGAPKLHL